MTLQTGKLTDSKLPHWKKAALSMDTQAGKTADCNPQDENASDPMYEQTGKLAESKELHL